MAILVSFYDKNDKLLYNKKFPPSILRFRAVNTIMIKHFETWHHCSFYHKEALVHHFWFLPYVSELCN